MSPETGLLEVGKEAPEFSGSGLGLAGPTDDLELGEVSPEQVAEIEAAGRFVPTVDAIAGDLARREAERLSKPLSKQIIDRIPSVLARPDNENVDDIKQRLRAVIDGDTEGAESYGALLEELRGAIDSPPSQNPEIIQQRLAEDISSILQASNLPEGTEEAVAGELAAEIVKKLTAAKEARQGYSSGVNYRIQFDASSAEIDRDCTAALTEKLALDRAEAHEAEVQKTVQWAVEHQMDAGVLEAYFVNPSRTPTEASLAEGAEASRAYSDVSQLANLLEAGSLSASQLQDLTEGLARWRREYDMPDSERPSADQALDAWEKKYGSLVERIPTLEARYRQLAALKAQSDKLEAADSDAPHMKLVQVDFDKIAKVMPDFNLAYGPDGPIAERYGAVLFEAYPECEVNYTPELSKTLRGNEGNRDVAVRYSNTPYPGWEGRRGVFSKYGLAMMDTVAASDGQIRPSYTRQELLDEEKATGVNCAAGLPEGLAWLMHNGEVVTQLVRSNPKAPVVVAFSGAIDGKGTYCAVTVEPCDPDNAESGLRFSFALQEAPEQLNETEAEAAIEAGTKIEPPSPPNRNCIRVVAV